MNIKDQALNVLKVTYKAPKMYAANKDSLINRVVTVLDVLGINNYGDFNKFLKRYGSGIIDANDSFEDEWAHKVIQEALDIVELYHV